MLQHSLSQASGRLANIDAWGLPFVFQAEVLFLFLFFGISLEASGLVDQVPPPATYLFFSSLQADRAVLSSTGLASPGVSVRQNILHLSPHPFYNLGLISFDLS